TSRARIGPAGPGRVGVSRGDDIYASWPGDFTEVRGALSRLGLRHWWRERLSGPAPLRANRHDGRGDARHGPPPVRAYAALVGKKARPRFGLELHPKLNTP